MLIVVMLQGFTLESDYNRAHQKAMQSDKIFIIFLTEKECVACNKELMKIMNAKNVSSLIEKNAIFVVVYKEQKNTFPIEMLYTTQYPTLFFLDKNELFSCKALRGNIQPKELMNCLKLR